MDVQEQCGDIWKIILFLAIVLFEIGWSVYTAGFGLALYRERDMLSLTSPLLLPYYPTAIGGQLVVIFTLLRAGLRLSSAKSIVSAISTTLNTVYFAFVGYGIVATRVESLDVGDNKSMFYGTIFLTISWGIVQLFFVFRAPQQRTKTLRDIRPRRTCRHIFRAVNTKPLSFLAIVLSFAGWVMSIKGIHEANPSIKGHLFMVWTATIVPPILYSAAIVYNRGCSETISRIAHTVVSIFNTIFTISMGYMVISSGEFLCCYTPMGASTQYLLVGGSLSLLSWTIVLVLWPLFQAKELS